MLTAPICDPGFDAVHRIDVPPRGLQLRAIRPEDEAWLLSIFASTRVEERQMLDWPGAVWDAFIRQQFTLQHKQYLAAYEQPCFQIILQDEQVVGRLYVARGATEIRLVDIALLPPYRRQGIARQLLQSLCDESDASHTPIGLHVEKNNPILAYYERLGFQTLADRGVYLYMQRAPRNLPIPSAEDFAATLDSSFTLMHLGGGVLATLRLTDVQVEHAGSMQICSVHFRGPDIGRSAHDNYLLAHPRLGRFSLFLGPVMGGAAGELLYQAVITRTPPQP